MADKTDSIKIYRNVGEIEEVVRKFETCAFSTSEFDHHAHLTIALWYLTQLPFDEAAGMMRVRLQRFIKHHGAVGYHETITLFWLKLVRRFLDENAAEQTLVEAANALLVKFADSKLISQFYSPEVIYGEAARVEWIAPDRQTI